MAGLAGVVYEVDRAHGDAFPNHRREQVAEEAATAAAKLSF